MNVAKKNVMWYVIAAVIVVGLAFYAGTKVPSSRDISFGPGQGPSMMVGSGGALSRSGSGGMINGEVLSLDDKSITVKLPNGGSKVVFFSGTTQFVKTIDAVVGDLVVGSKVIVNGSSNSDGSTNAQRVQLRGESEVGVPAPTSAPTQPSAPKSVQ